MPGNRFPILAISGSLGNTICFSCSRWLPRQSLLSVLPLNINPFLSHCPNTPWVNSSFLPFQGPIGCLRQNITWHFQERDEAAEAHSYQTQGRHRRVEQRGRSGCALAALLLQSQTVPARPGQCKGQWESSRQQGCQDHGSLNPAFTYCEKGNLATSSSGNISITVKREESLTTVTPNGLRQTKQGSA